MEGNKVCKNRVNRMSRSFSGQWTEAERQQTEADIAGSDALPVAKEYFRAEGLRKFKCCICGCDFWDRTGNNPWPIVETLDEETEDFPVCCHECNSIFVMAVRVGCKPGELIFARIPTGRINRD